MACCESPDPRILEKNSRPFCMSCRRYLDAKVEEPPELEDIPPPPPVEAEGSPE